MSGTDARGVDGLDFMSRIDVSLKNESEARHGIFSCGKWEGQRMGMT